MNNVLFFDSEKEYKRAKMADLYRADAVVVAGTIVKNRFGYDGIPYKGNFGTCPRCRKEIKQRELATSTFIGCMC